MLVSVKRLVLFSSFLIILAASGNIPYNTVLAIVNTAISNDTGTSNNISNIRGLNDTSAVQPPTTPETQLQQPANVTTDFLQYVNYTYGVKIQYPSDWEKDSLDDNPNDNVIYPIIRFSSPLENASDRFTENIVVAKENESLYKNLDQFLGGTIHHSSGLEDYSVIEVNTNSTLRESNVQISTRLHF